MAVDVLTPRQLQVLIYIAAGYASKQAADDLGVSIKTFDTHRTHLMARLGIHNVAGLTRYVSGPG
jgi:DNA-binding CsgD family transcriptional regulator